MKETGLVPDAGFSLIELLMAIFILGIGVISIAALFPAGIAQQQQSVDDVLGPTVARNAMTLLRTKLRDDDFARYLDLQSIGIRVHGDFPWARPAFLMDGVSLPGGNVAPLGSISIFDDTLANSTDTEVPFNDTIYARPPTIVFTPGERAYPMYTTLAGARQAQYHWDCMFRRFEGRMHVAVFVYRVISPPGESLPYTASANPSNPNVPPVPIALDLTDGANLVYSPIGAWDAFPFGTPPGVNVIPGTAAGAYDAADARQAWQLPRQWILDQNNNLHRVLGQFRDDAGDVQVELLRPVPQMSNLAVYYWPVPAAAVDSDNDGMADQDVVQNIWYMPTIDAFGRTLVPVYVAVEEL